nr:hypothetical protein BaRGS_005827 [Batillaria attramentaria]
MGDFIEDLTLWTDDIIDCVRASAVLDFNVTRGTISLEYSGTGAPSPMYSCTIQLTAPSTKVLHVNILELAGPCMCRTFHMSIYDGVSHVSQSGFRLLFSFHNHTALPEMLPDGKWNCSVPYFADFQQHFRDEDFCVFPPCDVIAEFSCGNLQCPGDGYCLPVYVRCKRRVRTCPGKEDEAACDSYTCPGFYRCRASRICLHPEHVCDGVSQCPQRDDELVCGLDCPENCTCYGLAFYCQRRFPAHEHQGLRYLDARGSGMNLEDFVDNRMLIYLSLADCGLEQLHAVDLPNMHSLDLSYNGISMINVDDLGEHFLVHPGQQHVHRCDVSTSKSKDLTIARRLFTVVMSDFLCWFPIGLLGLLASNGVAVPGEVNVVMAIIVLPLNSALNPFLYTVNAVMERRRQTKENAGSNDFLRHRN